MGARRIPRASRRATADDLQRARRIDSLGQDAAAQRETRRIWALEPAPETLPRNDALPLDAADQLWLRQFSSAGAECTPWFAFAREVENVAIVDLPADLTVGDVGGDDLRVLQ